MKDLRIVALAAMLALPVVGSAQMQDSTSTDQSGTVAAPAPYGTDQSAPTAIDNSGISASQQSDTSSTVTTEQNDVNTYHNPTLKEDEELNKTNVRPDDPTKNPYWPPQDWNYVSQNNSGG